MNLKHTLYIVLIFINFPLFADSAVVFMYHRFGESTYPSTNITNQQFQYQMNYLQKNNYKVWKLSKIIKYIKDKKQLPAKTVALTIDDAYISTYTNAYPILKSKNFPFTMFVNTDAIDNKSKFYISWEQMREMDKDIVEFANHSKSHDYLIQKHNELDIDYKNRVILEIQGAQLRLQEELGSDTNENPRLLSYPFGEYDSKLVNIIKELGYVGMTQTSGPIGHSSDLTVLTRFPMAEAYASTDGFKTKLNTSLMPIKSISPKEPKLKQNPPTLFIKLEKPLKNMACYISSGESIKLKWNSKVDLEVRSTSKIKAPRQKYTCTAPTSDGRWYWYSHLWIVK